MWTSHGEKDSDKRGTERGYSRRGTACKSMEAVWTPQAYWGWAVTCWLHGWAEKRKVEKAGEDQAVESLA